MIVDAFTFYNELDTLDIRLNHLDKVVDAFVLVEATKTHSGQEKKLYFQENNDRYKRWFGRIVHVVVDNMPPVSNGNRWELENYQRNCIKIGLDHLRLKDDDYLMISDVDEIPRAEVVEKRFFGVYDQRAFMYYLNVLINEHWNGTMGMTYQTFKDGFNQSAQQVRNRRDTSEPIRNAGWHFAWLGPHDRVLTKLQTFAHSELDTPEIRAGVEERIRNLNPLWDSNCQMASIPLDETFPDYVLTHQKELASIIHAQ